MKVGAQKVGSMRSRPGTRFQPINDLLPEVCGSCERHARYHDAGQCLGPDELADLRRARRGVA